MANLILRGCASRFTSSMTGMAPVPVPITSRRHFQGMSSSTERGVCPKAARNFFGRFLFALADVAPVDHDIMLISRPIDADRTKGKCFEVHVDLSIPESLSAGPSFAHNSCPGLNIGNIGFHSAEANNRNESSQPFICISSPAA
jgi:hypothetical protein